MRLGGLAGRLRPDASAADAAFDPVFYRERYPDLKGFPNAGALQRHYAAHGRQEGRHGNLAEAIAALEAELGALPKGFDPRTYRTLHADLRAAIKSDWEAAEHYLLAGRKEKREYFRFDPELYKSLYFADKVVTDYELKLDYVESGRVAGRFGSWADYMAQQGIASGDWVSRLKLDEFELLNWSWTGPVANKLDAVRLFLAEGVERLAPIAFDTVFEPAYYREAHPKLAGESNARLYRRWLFEGLAEDLPGSAEEHLRALGLRLRRFPTAFDWRKYARGRAGLTTRWTALEHFLEKGLLAGAEPIVAGEGEGEFYAALGERLRGKKDRLAAGFYGRARRAGERNYAVTHQLADALFRLDRWSEALPLFQEAAATPGAEVWTFVNGARAATKLKDHEAAFALLEAGKPTVGGEPAWRDAVQDAIEGYFMAHTDAARRLYGSAPRAEADAAVSAVIEEVKALWRRLDPIGAPLPPSPTGRIVMLASVDLRVCVHYRIEQKRELFERLGRPFEIYALDQWKDFVSALPGAAAAIIFRLPAWPSVVRAIEAARSLDVPTYYEIDDLIFDAEQYPDTLESYGGLLSTADYEGLLFGVPLFRSAIAMCDYGVVSTKPLQRAVEPLVNTGQVFWLPNGLDSRNEPWLESPPARVRRSDDVLIAYASGTKAHNSDFNELAGPALVKLLKQRPEVKLLLVGYLALDAEFDAVRDQIIRFDYVGSSESFWSMLADADISFAVLKPTWATDAKSEIKWLEAAVLGIPSVVSETAMYAEVLADGEDALIARTPDEWFAALERLAADPELRTRIGAAAKAKAAERYSLAANAARLEALLQPALERRSPAVLTGAKPRILLANVWFPPQTIGGATRVTRNNLDAWLDADAGEEFDFAVVASDHDVTPAHRQRVDSYRGVPVLRISTPLEVNMDWRPENISVGDLFTDLLLSWRPDLVHFHAVQRLTASAVESVQHLGIPYLVTTHDAWWVSDFHFLIDEQGRLHEPCEDLPRATPAGVSVAQSLDRRRVLRSALEGAEGVLGVSESFAAMHRRCGFARAVAVPNGVPPLPAIERRPSPSGRVRLAHVGNVTKHKGHHLVEAALKQSRFADLELTVIDHERAGGSEERLTWGATPVRIVGKTPQDRVHEFYAETDVLLAPSIWPESFGLVAREALLAGCWVVASDRGAMGEDVTPGLNGFVIDVSTVEGLLGALRAINDDPATYLRSPSTRPALRTAEDQAREVLDIYRRVLAGRPLV